MTVYDPKATFGVRGIESGEPPEVPFGIDPRAEKSPTDPRAAVKISMVRLGLARLAVHIINGHILERIL
jgi:hypothetical protein